MCFEGFPCDFFRNTVMFSHFLFDCFSLFLTIVWHLQIPLQDFIVRNDIACGSTIGPTLSSHSLRTADVGVPQLSMHSVREMCGVHDVDNAVKLFSAFYERFGEIEKEFDVDN